MIQLFLLIQFNKFYIATPKMYLNLENFKVYVISVTWDQNVVQQVFHDEFRSVGTQRVKSELHVLTNNENYALEYARKSFERANAEIVLERTEPIHAFIIAQSFGNQVSTEKVGDFVQTAPLVPMGDD